MGNPYRIKHKPTGLYLKPVTGDWSSKTNFSKGGKVYLNSTNMISYELNHGYSSICLYVSEKQYNKFKDIFDNYDKINSNGLLYKIPLSDLEIETL